MCTGTADAATLDMMRWKRCGLPDVENMEDMPNMDSMMGQDAHARRRRRYALQGKGLLLRTCVWVSYIYSMSGPYTHHTRPPHTGSTRSKNNVLKR